MMRAMKAMKMRLRKKLHLGEFQERCFEMRFTAEAEDVTAVWDVLATEAERRSLGIMGGGGPRFFCLVIPQRRSATAGDRTALFRTLRAHQAVKEPVAEPLTDVWWPDGYRRRPKDPHITCTGCGYEQSFRGVLVEEAEAFGWTDGAKGWRCSGCSACTGSVPHPAL